DEALLHQPVRGGLVAAAAAVDLERRGGLAGERGAARPTAPRIARSRALSSIGTAVRIRPPCTCSGRR
ncbi:hypothetical protein, partial [uncultured Arthrobacter sp.]|uniref:hypothetical protein n=1 Tax=uncultured Arthrobacter sp. TaxID=114050 RepID=UPI0025FB0B72